MASPDPPPPPTPSPQWLASGGFPMTAVCGVMMMDGEGWRGLTPTLLFWDVLWTDGHVVAHDPRWCSVPPAGRATVSPSLNYPLVHVRSDTCKRSPPLTHPEQKVLDHVPADPLLLLCQTSVRKSNSSSCCGRKTLRPGSSNHVSFIWCHHSWLPDLDQRTFTRSLCLRSYLNPNCHWTGLKTRHRSTCSEVQSPDV